jgi:hypothetical protein
MSRVTASTSISQVKPEQVATYTEKALGDIVDKVNGSLDFSTNFNCKEVSVTFGSTGTDTAVQHNLGRVATKYIVTSSTAAMNLYSGASTNTTSTLYLKSTAVGTVTLIVY